MSGEGGAVEAGEGEDALGRLLPGRLGSRAPGNAFCTSHDPIDSFIAIAPVPVPIEPHDLVAAPGRVQAQVLRPRRRPATSPLSLFLAGFVKAFFIY